MAAPISTQQYLAKIRKDIEQLREFDKELNREIFNIHSRHMQGIFGDGLEDTSYSTEPTLAGSNVFGKTNKFGTRNYTFATEKGSKKFFGSKKKIKEAEWATVSTPKGERSLIVIAGGYKAIREADGRRTDKVNLDHTGVLKKDMRSGIEKTSTGWVSGVRKEENVGKLEGQIARYGQKLAVPKKLLDEFNAKFGRIMLEILK